MKLVRFLRRSSPYSAGEIAGFPDRIAEEHIRRGNAVLHPPPEGSDGRAKLASERPRRKTEAKPEQ